MHPRLEIVPNCNDAGSAMHVGRPKTGAPVPTPARCAASSSSIAPAGFTANSTTSGTARLGCFRHAGNLRYVFRLHITQVKHELQRMLGFLLAFGRERNVVRVGAHRA